VRRNLIVLKLMGRSDDQCISDHSFGFLFERLLGFFNEPLHGFIEAFDLRERIYMSNPSNAIAMGVPIGSRFAYCSRLCDEVVLPAENSNMSTIASSTNSEQVARRAAKAGLVYVDLIENWITRHRCGKGFTYHSSTGKSLRDKRALQRIESLVIPPAWNDASICPRANGHIQAVGTDDAGRRQYIYHSRWQAISSATKFDRMILFGQCLPRIRRRVRRDVKTRGLSQNRVLAAVVRLLDKGYLRVGNQAYAETNKSYGATTLKNEHVEIERTHVLLDFPGKSGQQRQVELVDAKLAKIIGRCAELDGQSLFQYLDNEGKAHRIDSSDVNQYLRDASHEAITAKDFRTWWGSVLTTAALHDNAGSDSPIARKRLITDAVATTAKKLGNTKAVCRSSYIHPGILIAAESGELEKLLQKLPNRAKAELTIDETRFLAILPKLECT